MISVTEFSSNTNPTWPVIAAYLNSCVDAKTFDAFSERNLLFILLLKTSSASENNFIAATFDQSLCIKARKKPGKEIGLNPE